MTTLEPPVTDGQDDRNGTGRGAGVGSFDVEQFDAELAAVEAELLADDDGFDGSGRDGDGRRGGRKGRSAAGHGFWRGALRPAHTEPAGMVHIPALDGLRGLAVAAVLLYHADLLAGGYLGVDLFFVLSGFLITRLLVNETDRSGGVNLASFWGRRARRLLPALFLLLLAMPVFARLVAVPVTRGQIRTDGFGTLFYVANWHAILAGQNYWNQLFTPSPLSHTWSLAIEEQFYLVWPVVVAVVARRARRRGDDVGRKLLWVALTGAALSTALLLGLALTGASQTRLYQGTDTRVAAVLFGAVVALLYHQRGPARSAESRARIELLAWVGAGVLALAWFRLEGRSPLLYKGGLTACGLAGAAIIASVCQPHPARLSKLLSAWPLRLLGILSYGIYLAHWPIFLVLSPTRTGLSTWPLFALRVAVTLAVAALSYRYVERPIRERRLRFDGPTGRAVVVLAVAAICIGLVWSTRDAVSVQRIVSPQAVAEDEVATPATAPKPVMVSGAPRLLVVGDSVGFSLAGAPEATVREAGVSVRNISAAGCPLLSPSLPTRSFGEDVPMPVNGDCVLRWAPGVDDFRPDVVLVVFGSLPLSENRIGGRWVGPCAPSWDAALEARIRGWFKVLGRNGGQVVLATSALPGSDHYPPEYDSIEASVPFRELKQRVGCINAVYKKVSADMAGVGLADLANWVCPKGVCREQVAAGGGNIRVDHLHYTPAGAGEAVAWLYPQALKAARVVSQAQSSPLSTMPLQVDPPSTTRSTSTTPSTAATVPQTWPSTQGSAGAAGGAGATTRSGG